MRLRYAFVVLACLPFVFAAVGTAIGYGIGTHLPDYYRSLFRSPRDAQLDPVAFGMAQGLIQGLVLGVIVAAVSALALSAIRAWRDHRSGLQEEFSVLSSRLEHLQRRVSDLEEAERKRTKQAPSAITEKGAE